VRASSRIGVGFVLAVEVAGCTPHHTAVDPRTGAGQAAECAAAASLARLTRKEPFQNATLKGIPQSFIIEEPTSTLKTPHLQNWIAKRFGYKIEIALFPNASGIQAPSASDTRAYKSIIAQRLRYSREYQVNLDCSKAFKSAGLRIDPGRTVRDGLLTTGSLGEAGVDSYSRLIVSADGAVFVSKDQIPCQLSTSALGPMGLRAIKFISKFGDDSFNYQLIGTPSKNNWKFRKLGGQGDLLDMYYHYGAACLAP
jgi:hypothetical protein